MHPMIEDHKKKAKMEGLKELISQMHKMMMGGEKGGAIAEAMKMAEDDMKGKSEEPEHEMAEESGDDDLASKVKEYMKKGNKVPVKGAAVMMSATVTKKPEKKKMKYG